MTLLPPAERDLPAGRAEQMRAGLLTAIHPPRRTAARIRITAAAAAVMLIAAGVLAVRTPDDQILAMTTAEMNSPLRSAAQQCLTWNRDDIFPSTERGLVDSADVVLSARQGHRAAVMFLNDTGYLACEVTDEPWSDISGGLSVERWTHRDWVPGPVQILILTSSDADGGAVTVLGRVSSRAGRVTLEHGTGRTTDARLEGGVFGLLSSSGDVREDADLVTYDTAGRVIDRRKLLRPRPDTCWTGPDGTIFYGSPGPACGKAEPWVR
jgi:hypothetical protein